MPIKEAAQPVRSIVIVGGGTAGWMAAAPLSQRMGKACTITLVESPEIGTIGVGEATLPTIRAYNRSLGLDGADFVKRTQGSFKLGIDFQDWGHVGNRFFHGFGDFGPPIENRSAFAWWLRLASQGQMPSYEEWSVATQMAYRHRFTPPQGEQPSAHNAFSFAYHFDAGLYAAYLREYAMARGAQRVEGMVTEVELRPEDGFVAALKLKDGRRIEGDLFIDASGFRGLLINGAMQVPFEDWTHWLPCNSALAVPSARVEPLTPYTRSTAKRCGWQWRIPLQHRTGNGHVYCSEFMGDDEAAEILLKGLDAPPLDSPRQLRFTTGRRKQHWVKNVVAVGLSAGFLEPLESTSIQLIMDAVGRLIQYFPDRGFAPALAAEFNRHMAVQYESVRDFIILHYKLNRREDSEFWRYLAAMPIPDQLAHQIELFRSTGHVAIFDRDGFAEPSWISLLMGLGAKPERIDPVTALIDEQALRMHFERVRQAVSGVVGDMPDHADYIRRHCAAPNPGVAQMA